MEEMPFIPLNCSVEKGLKFLEETIVDPQHCYICKKEINKDKDTDVSLLKIKTGTLAFVHQYHTGVVQEFIRQYKIPPGGWKKYEKEDTIVNID